MSDALAFQLESFPSNRDGRRKSRSAHVVSREALPTLQPGQLWMIELPSTGSDLSPLEYGALSTANVLIYDRLLAPIVAKSLRLGGYAEPAGRHEAGVAAAWERCLRFAREGWSVARLVQPDLTPGRREADRARQLSRLLLAGKLLGGVPAPVFLNVGGGVYHKLDIREQELDGIIDLLSRKQSTIVATLTNGLDGPAAPHFAVASANGLAG